MIKQSTKHHTENGGELRCYVRINISCSISGNSRVKNPVIRPE